jgi:hypothetical protein
MRRWVALAALAGGCADWPALDPVDMDPLLDDRHGVELFRSRYGLRIAQIYQVEGLLVVFEDPSAGWHARLVDPETLEVAELPAPPLDPGEVINLGRGLAPVRAVLAVVRGDQLRVMLLEGDVWEVLPAPPIDVSGSSPAGILAHDGQVLAFAAGRLVRWDGQAWDEPVTAATIVLGGFDADTQWVLTEAGSTFAAIPIDAGGEVGAAIVGPDGAGAPQTSAVNGDATTFQFVAGSSMWVFDGEGFSQGDPIASIPFSAPGSPRVLCGGEASGAWNVFEGGLDGGVALAPFAPVIDDHTVDYVALRPSPDVARMSLTMADDLAGYAVLSVRFIDLPFAGDPFGS